MVEGLQQEPGIEAEILPINPRLPRPLGWLQRIKYVRTAVTTLVYIATLLIRLPRYDVVHIFSASYWSFLLAPAPAILIARLYGKATLLNYHSGEAEDHLRNWRTALPVIRLADRVIVPSEYLVDVFARFGVKAQAIFNTVDLDRFAFRQRRALKPVLLSNRNLETLYNVGCTLRAFALIARSIPEARLIIAGDGSQRAALEKLARELELKNVEFVGAISPDRMPALYDRADIFVNASNIDNMPLSIIEAFACGLAVVTSDAGGIPYIVADRNNGLIFPREDHAAMARAVLELIEDRELSRLIITNARAEREKYAWAAVRDQWVAVYTGFGSDLAANESKTLEVCKRASQN
jgi:glycosyltransferase involved in cell wall biosynthesis